MCKHCCKEISRGGRSSKTYNTTNLVNHLKTVHVSGPFKKYCKDVEAASKTNSLSDKSRLKQLSLPEAIRKDENGAYTMNDYTEYLERW